MSKNEQPIKFLDKLLGDYYKLQGDSSFYDKDGKGKSTTKENDKNSTTEKTVIDIAAVLEKGSGTVVRYGDKTVFPSSNKEVTEVSSGDDEESIKVNKNPEKKIITSYV